MNLPPYDKMKIRESSAGKPMVLDILRRRFVKLTPEEMVRQYFINYLITYKGYPRSLMANEVELRVGEKRVRCDSLLYDRELHPRMIIEFKAPDINISEKVLNQILSYNILLHVPYLIMSNGTQHVCLKLDTDNDEWQILPEIPDYGELC